MGCTAPIQILDAIAWRTRPATHRVAWTHLIHNGDLIIQIEVSTHQRPIFLANSHEPKHQQLIIILYGFMVWRASSGTEPCPDSPIIYAWFFHWFIWSGFMMTMTLAAVVPMVGATIFLVRGPHWKHLWSVPVVMPRIMPSTARPHRLLARVLRTPRRQSHWPQTGNCLMNSWVNQRLRIVVPAHCHWNIRA